MLASVSVLPDATVVFPFRETVPVPVWNVPLAADWSKLPEVKVIPVTADKAPELMIKLLIVLVVVAAVIAPALLTLKLVELSRLVKVPLK